MSFPLLASRSEEGLHLFENVHQKSSLNFKDAIFHDPLPEKKMHKAMQFSPDGKTFAFVNEETGVQIYDVAKNKIVFTIDLPRTLTLQFSPQSKYLCLQQPNYAAKKGEGAQKNKNNEPPPNVTVWDLDKREKINEILNKGSWNGFIWSPKEDSWYGRISTDGKSVLFFEPEQGQKVVHKFQPTDGAPIKAFSVGEGKSRNGRNNQDPLVAIFTPEWKSATAKVRVHRYPDFSPGACLASKSFYKAEDAILAWSSSASAVTCLASTETGPGYYGTSQLHHLSTRGRAAGEAALVPLSKTGPTYDVQWQPYRERFCVVHGYMPSNATIFTSPKLDVVFHWEGISKNTVLYSPGNSGLLALCGFGNVSGKVSVYQTEKKEKICEFDSANTTMFNWASNGKHFVAATTTPRLRIDNRIDVLDYSGKRNFRFDVNVLFEVAFQPVPELAEAASFELSDAEVKQLQKQTKSEEVKTSNKKFIPASKRKMLEAQKAAGKTAPGQNPEKVLENKIKGLRKKISSIKQLKADPSKIVNDEQRDKIKKEKEFIDEMAELTKKLKELKG